MQIDLAALAERPQPLADPARDLAADPGVDLVEDQRRRLGCPGRGRTSASITRESSPPEAVSPSGASGIPGLVATRSSIVSAPVGPKPSGAGTSATSSRRPVHRQLAELGGDRALEPRRGLGARRR